MPKKPKSKEPSKRDHRTGDPKSRPDKVPPEAENFEHTIRRSIRQKHRERSKRFGLYL